MRRKWVQNPKTGELIPYEQYIDVSNIEYIAKNNPLAGDRHYDGLRATDGADISTRTKHREYMKLRGLTTADDFTQTWEKAAQERAKVFTGERMPDRRQDLEKAVHQLENRRK